MWSAWKAVGSCLEPDPLGRRRFSQSSHRATSPNRRTLAGPPRSPPRQGGRTLPEVSPTIGLWLALALVPLALTLATAFTKSLIVFGSLRVGLGAEALIPWPAVLAVSIVATTVVMLPTATATWSVVEAAGGLDAIADGSPAQWASVAAPLLEFVQAHASTEEVNFYAELMSRSATDPFVSVAAFVTTELSEALMMAVVILIPLLLVDLVAAQVIVLLGLVQQPTAVVTVPLKLLLFLGVGGWDVVIGGLVKGYA